MYICEDNHARIVFDTTNCPLCLLTKHNNLVHDFIERDPEILKGFKDYINKNSQIKPIMYP